MKSSLFYNNIAFRLVAPSLFGVMIYLLILMVFDSIDMIGENFFSREVIFIIGISFLFFELNRLVIVILNQVFGLHNIRWRIGIQYLTTILITTLSVSAALYTYFIYIEGFSTIKTELITFNSLFLFVAVFYHLFFFSIVYLHKKNEAKVEKELSLKSILDAELQSFKYQVNPELLFQALEIIISELHKDKKSADDLINQLSRIYRYTLDNKHNDLVSLKEELKSIEPLKKLFGAKYPGAIKVQADADKNALSQNMVPGSLILLMEKALSENIISTNLNLNIQVTGNTNELIFQYDHNPKINQDKHTSGRIENLKRSYSYFSDINCSESKEDGVVTLRLPLLEIKDELE